jgi:hypothetical protein
MGVTLGTCEIQEGRVDKDVTFRTGIEFRGSAEQFQGLAANLVDLPIRLRVEWPPGHTAGRGPIGPVELLGPRAPERTKVIDEVVSIRVLEGICGGIRDPHVQMGDAITFLSREAFKELIGQVATELGGQIAAGAEHTEAVGAIRDLAKGVAVPGPIP